MALFERVGFQQVDCLFQVALTCRRHISDPRFIFDPEADQQTALNNGELAIVEESPTTNVGK